LKLAQQLHYQYFEMIHFLFVEGNPAGVKAALQTLGITGDAVRLPLVNVSNKTKEKIKALMVTY
jgi:4-hydroxy-tetrahydrodipicolinate synthase